MENSLCPFCGAGHEYAAPKQFDCGSPFEGMGRSFTCYERQIATLQAKVANGEWVTVKREDLKIVLQAIPTTVCIELEVARLKAALGEE